MSMLANARMYSVTPGSKAAWSRLFEWVIARAGVDVGLVDHDPPKLLSDLWERSDLGAVMMCGLPLSRRTVQPVILAQPLPSLSRYAGRAVYCTDIVVGANSPFSTLEDTFGHRAGYTLKDSQSGYYAFRHHLMTAHASVREPYTSITGGLMNPRGVIKAIAENRIDVGPLDGYVHDLIRHTEPEYAAQVRIIAATDPTPMPAIIATAPIAETEVARMRDAFKAAIATAELAAEREALLLADFLVPDAAVYQVQRDRAVMVDTAPEWP
jgi:ABC-type phosphate/phosphonate transport system substrate-binding protein